MFVFTDAEEACLCGAEAFVSQDPLARDGGVALNFESRGSSGPAIMFETTRDNAGVVGVYADAVPDPVATSFAVEVYRILPNDTDFTAVPRRRAVHRAQLGLHRRFGDLPLAGGPSVLSGQSQPAAPRAATRSR